MENAKFKMYNVSMSEQTKNDMRASYYRKKSFVMTLFGEEREYNIAMLYGELNVLQSIGVYTEEVAEKEKRYLLGLL